MRPRLKLVNEIFYELSTSIGLSFICLYLFYIIKEFTMLSHLVSKLEISLISSDLIEYLTLDFPSVSFQIGSLSISFALVLTSFRLNKSNLIFFSMNRGINIKKYINFLYTGGIFLALMFFIFDQSFGKSFSKNAHIFFQDELIENPQLKSSLIIRDKSFLSYYSVLFSLYSQCYVIFFQWQYFHVHFE